MCQGCYGTSTVETSTVKKERGFDGNFTYGMDSIGTTKRNLLNPDEISSIQLEKLVVPFLCLS